jgi:N-acyl-phosphatidylethanolamine-hydrolysing phospholipase D
MVRPVAPGARALALGLALALALAGCAGVGDPVPGAPAHHRERGFANPTDVAPLPGVWRRTVFLASRVLASTLTPRSLPLPLVVNDGRALRDSAGRPTVTWVGHSTLIVQLDGVTVLTDPHWSRRASPLAWAGPRRLNPPAIAFEDLPPIHVVLISHDHYDHLDVATVQRLAATHRPRFLVPLGLKAWFADVGVHDVEELDWWDQRVVGGLTLTCVPAQHFASRTLWDRNRRLWAGWTIAGRDRRLYFAGDTAYFDGFRTIGERLGPFDLAVLPIGAYLPPDIMRPSHTSPEEALRAFADLRAGVMIPVHWGTFDLAEEPLDEPPRRLEAEARRTGVDPARIWRFRLGETRAW